MHFCMCCMLNMYPSCIEPEPCWHRGHLYVWPVTSATAARKQVLPFMSMWDICSGCAGVEHGGSLKITQQPCDTKLKQRHLCSNTTHALANQLISGNWADLTNATLGEYRDIHLCLQMAQRSCAVAQTCGNLCNGWFWDDHYVAG